MKFMSRDPETRAEDKALRMAKKVASHVYIEEGRLGVQLDRVETFIGRTPRAWTPQQYANVVGSFAVIDLHSSGNPGFTYSREETEAASEELHLTGMGNLYDAEGCLLVTDSPSLERRMGNWVTLVLVRKQEQTPQLPAPDWAAFST